jgi:hypothetical protein
VPKQIVNLLASDTKKKFCVKGTSDAPVKDDTGTPLGEMLCVGVCVPVVLINAPDGVADKLKTVPTTLRA